MEESVEVDALVYAETRFMLDFHPSIAQVHVVDRRWKELAAPARLMREWRLHAAMRERGYDLIVHLSEHPRGAWLARSLGVRFFTRQNGRYFPTTDAQLIFEQINAVYKKVDDLADVIGELDVNPLVVRPKGAVALDALIVRK